MIYDTQLYYFECGIVVFLASRYPDAALKGPSPCIYECRCRLPSVQGDCATGHVHCGQVRCGYLVPQVHALTPLQ